MRLDTYIATCRATPDHDTADALELEDVEFAVVEGGFAAGLKSAFGLGRTVTTSNMLARLIEVRDIAEAEAVEYGFNLHFEGSKLRAGALQKGTKTKLALNTRDFKDKPNYCGDFHVHPYEKKMGETATVGPSMDDIMGWLDDRPTASQTGLYMVFAGSLLCITILRAKTKNVEDLSDIEPKLEMDFVQANTWARDELGRETVDRWFTARDSLEQAGKHWESIAKERELWDQLPGYAPKFSRFNAQLNIRVASHLQFEYFLCDIDGPRTARLVSSKVYP